MTSQVENQGSRPTRWNLVVLIVCSFGILLNGIGLFYTWNFQDQKFGQALAKQAEAYDQKIDALSEENASLAGRIAMLESAPSNGISSTANGADALVEAWIAELEGQVQGLQMEVYVPGYTSMGIQMQYLAQKLGLSIDKGDCGPDHTGFVIERRSPNGPDQCAWGFAPGSGVAMSQHLLVRTQVFVTEGGYPVYEQYEYVVVDLPHYMRVDEINLPSLFPADFEEIDEGSAAYPKDGVHRFAFDLYGVTSDQANTILASYRHIGVGSLSYSRPYGK